MIAGINVLAQHTVLVQIGTTWGFSGLAVFGSILIILGLVVIYSIIKEKDCPAWAPMVLIIMFAIGVVSWHQKPIKQECIEYKATIDETVSLKEFDKQYIILDKDGEIYTFRERAETEINN